MSAAKELHNRILKKLEEIPTLPAIVYELSRVINDPMASTKEVERIMANDVSMTAKVLKLANSAYYAIPGGVSNLSRAIAYIGFDAVNQLVLSASIINALDVEEPNEFDLNQFWKHSIGVGIAAETIAKYTGHPTPADLFTCGLVHDMGKVAIIAGEPQLIADISNHAVQNKVSFHDAEEAMDAPRHVELGLAMAERWLLPRQFQAVVRFHHENDPRKRGGITDDLNRAVDIVFLANLLIHALKFGNSGHSTVLGAPKTLMERMQIDPQKDFKALLIKIKGDLERAADFIKLIGSDL
ncbi:MAG: HDOD domain-containing protein [Pseudobdellovibrionaceae bacterium]|nr:HDOD domain-containing protein [Bdellovibrionales bacterium]USN47839.1 MAG: HDOD domain-containing protein [Pseudobdellovibrionaceae bacterium]